MGAPPRDGSSKRDTTAPPRDGGSKRDDTTAPPRDGSSKRDDTTAPPRDGTTKKTDAASVSKLVESAKSGKIEERDFEVLGLKGVTRKDLPIVAKALANAKPAPTKVAQVQAIIDKALKRDGDTTKKASRDTTTPPRDGSSKRNTTSPPRDGSSKRDTTKKASRDTTKKASRYTTKKASRDTTAPPRDGSS